MPIVRPVGQSRANHLKTSSKGIRGLTGPPVLALNARSTSEHLRTGNQTPEQRGHEDAAIGLPKRAQRIGVGSIDSFHARGIARASRYTRRPKTANALLKGGVTPGALHIENLSGFQARSMRKCSQCSFIRQGKWSRCARRRRRQQRPKRCNQRGRWHSLRRSPRHNGHNPAGFRHASRLYQCGD